MTLVVVGSALHRMDLYQRAYGFTRLRLLVDAFEGWLGLVVLAVLVAGVGLCGWWLPRMALLSGAAVLLALAVANSDAWVARHNIERYQATGKVDWDYLRGLSADAAPTLAALPVDQATCALPDRHALTDDPWTGRPWPGPGRTTTWRACTPWTPPPPPAPSLNGWTATVSWRRCRTAS
jgi:two-component system sensor histidine kinase BaeS